jgi:hypothetical protein
MKKRTRSTSAKKVARQALPKARPKRTRRSASRMTTHKPNGGLSETTEVPEISEPVPIGEAQRLAVEQLGKVTIDPGLAPTQLLELAEAYEQVTREQAAYNARAEATKTAKKSLESATNLLLEKVRSFTHAAPLPLFDQAEREADHEDMLDAMEADA